MHIDTLVDGHVHTSMCQHAVGSMEEYVVSAIAKGLRKIIFLEHMEEGIQYRHRTWLTETDFDYYFEEGQRLKKRYIEKIEIGLGVEVGYNPDCSDKLIDRLRQRNWDRIGISYHYCKLPGLKEHLNILSRKQQNIKLFKDHGASDLLYRYFDTLTEAVQTIPGQVLCHLDAGLRHYPQLELDKRHQEQIKYLLTLLKRTGIALEINTSGYDIRNNPFPMPHIIEQALKLGIPFVAGSDAHSPKEVGRHFEKLPGLM